MKAKELISGIIVFIVSFLAVNSFCLGAVATVTQGDDASNPLPPTSTTTVLIQAPAVTTQAAPTVTYGTVNDKKLLEDTRVTYDTYEEKKFGKQFDVQIDLKLPSLETQESVIGNENALTENADVPANKEEGIISLLEMQQQLQEDKLILSKPIPLFVGGS